MGMAIAAIGSMAGSLAGGAAMKALGVGPPPPAKPDTNIPGISSATLQKSTKSSPGLTVAQVNPSQAIDYFKKAAATSESYFQQGLRMYGASINSAISEINSSYAQANNTLYPAAQAGISALNKELQFMGMSPISPSAGLGGVAASIGNYPELQKQLTAAEAIKDPVQRAAAREQILNTVKGLKQELTSTPEPAIYQAQKMPDVWRSRQQHQAWDAKEQAKVAASQLAYDKWKGQQSDLEVSNLAVATTNAALDKFATQFDTSYSPEYANPLSATQIQQELENTPGYQFQLSQGLDSLQRTASARGNLISGSAMAGAVKYGQGLADTTFQQALANLSSIATQGLPANAQIAANQASEGQANAALITQIGAATANTYNAIGNQYAASYTNAGNTAYNASVFNADAQNKALSQKRAADDNMKQQALASGAGYMNAQTAQNQFQYDVFKGQQQGQAFYGNGGGYNILPVGGTVGGPGNPPASYGALQV